MSTELDQQVAQEVLGWKKTPLNKDDWPYIEWMWDKKEGAIASEVQETPEFSTEIAAAWQIVERLNKEGFMVSLDSYDDGTSNISVLRLGSGQIWFTFAGCRGNTVPEAICKAGLRVRESGSTTR